MIIGVAYNAVQRMIIGVAYNTLQLQEVSVKKIAFRVS
jgi:hypothetical protein